MDEVRRETDGELCGFVTRTSMGWQSLTVFGVTLGDHDDREAATAHVIDAGLACLAERWQLRRRGEAHSEVVCIQEADRTGVTVALGYYSLPGVPTRRLSTDELRSGEWELLR
ncbi:MAG TPA: hypothetical protein VF855_06200 [Acidimicrobiales bacterium]